MGGRLPDNAWRLNWFLAISRNAHDAGIGTASVSMLGVAANAQPRAIASPVPALKRRPTRRRNSFSTNALAANG